MFSPRPMNILLWSNNCEYVVWKQWKNSASVIPRQKVEMNDRWFGTPSGSIWSRWSWCDERSTKQNDVKLFADAREKNQQRDRDKETRVVWVWVGVGGWLLGEREHTPTHTHPAYPISSTLICVNVSMTDQRCSPYRRLFPCRCSTSQRLEPILNCLCSINSSNTRLICEVSEHT